MTSKIKVSLVSATALVATFGLVACSGSSEPATSESAQSTSATSSETPTTSESPSSIAKPLEMAGPSRLGDKALSLTVTADQQTAIDTRSITVSGGSISINVRGTTAVEGNRVLLIGASPGTVRIFDRDQEMKRDGSGTSAQLHVNNIDKNIMFIVRTVKPADVPKDDKLNDKNFIGSSEAFGIVYKTN